MENIILTLCLLNIGLFIYLYVRFKKSEKWDNVFKKHDKPEPTVTESNDFINFS